MTYTERARKMRPYIEQAASALDDKTVSLAPELLGTLTGDGSLVKAGTRINWHGKIKKSRRRPLGHRTEHARQSVYALGGRAVPGRVQIHPRSNYLDTGLRKGREGLVGRQPV